MDAPKISDEAAHELVMKRIETMTREEWQAWLDHVAEVFGPHDGANNQDAVAVDPHGYRPRAARVQRSVRGSAAANGTGQTRAKPAKKRTASAVGRTVVRGH